MVALIIVGFLLIGAGTLMLGVGKRVLDKPMKEIKGKIETKVEKLG